MLKASDYFQTDLEGFTDSEDRFKVFREGEAPSTNAPYVTIELRPIERDQRNRWNLFTAIFHVIGEDTDRVALKQIVYAIPDIFEATDTLPAIEDDYPELKYQLIGKAVFDNGSNPVTDEVTESVALTFGIEA